MALCQFSNKNLVLFLKAEGNLRKIARLCQLCVANSVINEHITGFLLLLLIKLSTAAIFTEVITLVKYHFAYYSANLPTSRLLPGDAGHGN